MRKFSLFATAFVLAAGTFWATMFTSPPKSEAAVQASINTRELTLRATPPMGEQYDAF